MALILLPPSESKNHPRRGTPYSAESRPVALRTPTERTLSALVELCASDPAAAIILGLAAAQHHLVAENAQLRTAPTAAAWRIYSGVLFEALEVRSLTRAARRRAESSVLVASMLFGVVGFGEPIPAYRLTAGTRLPNLPDLKSLWRGPVDEVVRPLLAEHGVALDLRSGAYSGIWPIPSDLTGKIVVGKIWQESADGHRVAVSHFNKAAKGRLTRTLLTTRRRVDTPQAVQLAAAAAGWRADLVEPTGRRPWRLDITLDASELGG